MGLLNRRLKAARSYPFSTQMADMRCASGVASSSGPATCNKVGAFIWSEGGRLLASFMGSLGTKLFLALTGNAKSENFAVEGQAKVDSSAPHNKLQNATARFVELTGSRP
jgi:hypothetical protein